jgi:hypothetical protein
MVREARGLGAVRNVEEAEPSAKEGDRGCSRCGMPELEFWKPGNQYGFQNMLWVPADERTEFVVLFRWKGAGSSFLGFLIGKFLFERGIEFGSKKGEKKI